MIYYHGGTPDLFAGDEILPSCQTGVPPTVIGAAAEVVSAYRPDRVYLTPNVHFAALFAARHPSGRGQVYECLPFGEVVADLYWRRLEQASSLLSGPIECAKALITRTVEISLHDLECAERIVRSYRDATASLRGR